jgi:outer membrane protein TolC
VRRAGASILLVAALVLASPRRSAGQGASSPFLGSVPTGRAEPTDLAISLKDALGRALQYNLGLIESEEDSRSARAVRLRNLSSLLPDLSARVSATRQTVNLQASGLRLDVPGVLIPIVVGPFSVADARGYASLEIFNWSSIKSWKSAAEAEKAARYSYRSDRDLVVYTTANAYLVVISDEATAETTRAQLKTAETLHQRTVDQNRAGVVAAIDALRARVELQTQQQRLIAAENQLAIDKLGLARVIGLPKGQAFHVSDAVPYAPLSGIGLEESLQRAYTSRPDYLAAQARVRAADEARQAAAAGYYPSIGASGSYGAIGSPNFGSAHDTYSVGVAVSIPLFPGTRVKGDKLQADAALQQRRAELADLDGRIDEEVRTAFFNLHSSSEQVVVAESNRGLAAETLTQAQERFAAGVADNLEVVQAQESVAAANQSYIAAVYAHNLAKVSLSVAMGTAEQSALPYLGAK